MAKEHPKFKVYTTNADLEACKFMGEFVSRDVAESYVQKWHIQSMLQLDIMIMNGDNQELCSAVFSARTMQLRGECRG